MLTQKQQLGTLQKYTLMDKKKCTGLRFNGTMNNISIGISQTPLNKG